MGRHAKRFSLALILLAAPASGQTPVGPEFQVNTYTTNRQVFSEVTSGPSGSFVVVWESVYQDGPDVGIFGQRFDGAGVPQGDEFLVNAYITGVQYRPHIASDGAGNFVVVWHDTTRDGNGFGIFGRRFSAAGTPLGGDFQVNSYTTGNQWVPRVASRTDGSFVVVWFGQDGSAGGVFGRRFDAAGLAEGAEFQINTFTTADQSVTDVALDASGNFVVVWNSYGEDGSRWGIFGRRFDATGSAQGSAFQVNSSTTESQFHPTVVFDAGGGFVVVWWSEGQDADRSDIFGRRFNAAGSPQGLDFQINTYTTGRRFESHVASDASGGFTVAWSAEGQDGNLLGIFARRYLASGAPAGGEFQVNSHTTYSQRYAAIASGPPGHFVVTWASHSQDGHLYGIFGQRFSDLIFKDGFEP
jgi:hypothetical protein